MFSRSYTKTPNNTARNDMAVCNAETKETWSLDAVSGGVANGFYWHINQDDIYRVPLDIGKKAEPQRLTEERTNHIRKMIWNDSDFIVAISDCRDTAPTYQVCIFDIYYGAVKASGYIHCS